MKWTEWSDNHWVLTTPDGEVVDEIRRSSDFFFVLASTKKKYINLKSAKNARTTNTPNTFSQ